MPPRQIRGLMKLRDLLDAHCCRVRSHLTFVSSHVSCILDIAVGGGSKHENPMRAEVGWGTVKPCLAALVTAADKRSGSNMLKLSPGSLRRLNISAKSPRGTIFCCLESRLEGGLLLRR